MRRTRSARSAVTRPPLNTRETVAGETPAARATSLIEHGSIETTEAKAKELRPFVEKLITKARTGTLHARRLAGRHIRKREAADKLFQEIGPRYASRQGGYTRILKTGHRKGDGADMARIELIEG
jgi:large subunit ribosomal protein L17